MKENRLFCLVTSYEIIVYTGKQRGAGTDAQVYITLFGKDGKQIRPKRGQYRRYESEQLAKAVAAVLSNEMSVHKAGSYFGVPHSTVRIELKRKDFSNSCFCILVGI